MAPRKSANQLRPQDFSTQFPASSSPPSPGAPRSASPSSGFTNFFTKPGKWFNRRPSSGTMSPGATEPPRASTSSTGRKPKISRPTDPRPLLAAQFQSDSRISSSATRSVLDLSTRPPGSLDMSQPFPFPSQPSSPSSGGFGDLRSISRKAWSRSADDLGKFASPMGSPVDRSFHNKITQYRNRSNSNATVAPSSSSININPPTNMRQPFPNIITTPPISSSPPSDTDYVRNPGQAISISVSSPSSLDKPLPHDPGQTSHAHNRSHSFTPKLPSKLSAQKLGFGPSSPKRKASNHSEREIEKDNEVVPLVDMKGVFSGGPNSLGRTNTPPPNARAALIPVPPTIMEPVGQDIDPVDNSGSKRTSQIVYHSGFINRLTELPASHHPYHVHNLILSKGWKAFKLELKGSKLFFYKPPGDRGAAIRELFPVHLVPALEDEGGGERAKIGDAMSLIVPKNFNEKEEGPSSPVRKKRAYWGRGTHPELVHGGTGVERGTFEALVHEAVFATTMLKAAVDDSMEDAKTEQDKQVTQWKDFASAILLCLPTLVRPARFENEFTRCSAYLVSGAGEDIKENMQSRVTWLAGEYLRYHGAPAELSEWEEWRAETIPDFQPHASNKPAPGGISTSSSIQALYARSPNPAADSPTFSPNLGTFSPRPEAANKTTSLTEALAAPVISSFSGKELSREPQRIESANNHRIWSALELEGLSREVLLVLDPCLIARSLGLFHRAALQEIPGDLTAEHIIGSEDNNNDKGPAPEANHELSPAALFGSEKSPHWLTKILLMQILGVDTSTGSLTSPQMLSPSRLSEDRSTQMTSRTHSRSEVISVWARIGEFCRLSGDECSWRAIAAALCSRPVARLDKAWKRVNSDALKIVESWVYPGTDGECVNVQEPRITPWGGSVKDRIKEKLEGSKDCNGESWLVEPLVCVREMFEGTRTAFSLCPRRLGVEDSSTGEDVIRMMAFWGELHAGNVRSGTLGSKFLHVEQFMSLSLAAEPRRKGLFEPFFWSQASSAPPPSHPLVPLLFPQPLPVIALIDRREIWRGRMESGLSNLNVTDLQFLRSLEPRSDDRRSSVHKNLLSGLGGVDPLGSILAVYEGELLLIIQRGGAELTPVPSRASSLAPSRPLSTTDEASSNERRISRTPSIRVKTGPLERKPSVARRSSLPAISRRPPVVSSESSSEPPLRVLVHAGTVDRLVDILVHGLRGVSVSVADDNGEMSLREGKTRDLAVNHNDFARVWWSVFRGFVTPLAFFELLRKRYPGLQSPRQSLSVSDYLDLIRIRSQVIDTMNEWMVQGGGTQDVLDDATLYNGIQSFLDDGSQHASPTSPAFNNFAVQQAWSAYEQRRKSYISSFVAQTMRPTSRDASLFKPPVGNIRTQNMARDPPDIDRIDPEQLVESFDAMGAAAFSNISEEDLLVTTDLFEVQMADRTGWFLPREPVSTTDDVEIQTMYSHTLDVEASPMISELAQDAIYRLLPPGIRSCIRAYRILRKWLISKLVSSQIGLRVRQTRMDKVLRAIEVTRLRSADSNASNFSVADSPCVRSFVEAVLTSAVVSVESRAHYRAWQNVAAARGAQCDSLTSLLRKPLVQPPISTDPLTVDMSWLLERILEIISMPDVLRPTSEEGLFIINLEKRRHICNLIMNASTITSPSRHQQCQEVDRRDLERLNIIEREVSLLQFDQRGIREEAHRENIQAAGAGSSSGRKSARPFQKLVVMQQEKNKRDKHVRDRVSKEKKHEQHRTDKRDDHVNKNVQRTPGAIAQRQQHRNKKSMSSAFFQFMRPISSAFTSEHPDPSGTKRTPAELDFAPSGKPTLVLNVVDAKVAQFINNERSFTFQLDTEDGGHYLLQAVSRREMTKWLDTISRVSKTAAKRRLTYIGSPKPQLADHIHNPTTSSRDPRAVFGVELNFLLKREAANGDVLPGAIPFIVERCLHEIESRGLSEVGIYRIAGAVSEINALKEAFNRGENPIGPSTDIHAVCDLTKTWFRVLSEPLFPPSSYHDVIESMKINDFDLRLSKIRTIVRCLPRPNFDLLKRVAEHLDKVTDYEEQNHMTADALAIVFSPNLLRAPQNDFAMILSNMGHTHKLVKSLITHFHVIFDDTDQEIENEQDEDEFDEPILEEDEDDDDDLQLSPTSEPSTQNLRRI